MNHLHYVAWVSVGYFLVSVHLPSQQGGLTRRHADLVDSGLIPLAVTPAKSAFGRSLGELSVLDNGFDVVVERNIAGSAPVALTALVHLRARHAGDWYAAQTVRNAGPFVVVRWLSIASAAVG